MTSQGSYLRLNVFKEEELKRAIINQTMVRMTQTKQHAHDKP